MMRKRVLYILKHDPWGIGGGGYASLMYLTVFRELFLSYHMDVLICDNCMAHQPVDWKDKCYFIPVPPRGQVFRCFSILTGIMHRYQKPAIEMLRSNDYEYCIFDHNQIAGTLVNYVKPSTKSIVIHHNVEQNYFADNNTSVLLKTLILPQVKRCERVAYKNCDYNIFLTDEDKLEFRLLYGDTKGSCATVGLFDIKAEKSNLCANPVKEPSVVISGSLCNVQNVDGINYFVSELYPLIPSEVPVIISGKNPQPSVIDALKILPNVILVANPENMNDIIRKASIYVCPTRLGSGIKVRISDGLKNGLPVIAHEVSARGYGEYIKKGYLFPFSNPEEFKKALSFVVERQKNGYWDSANIKELYFSNNSLAAGCKRLKEFIL